jgi:hypothetical protein
MDALKEIYLRNAAGDLYYALAALVRDEVHGASDEERNKTRNLLESAVVELVSRIEGDS